ncbi:DNA-binding transcriptional regulator, HxlR family [Saccharopolyspora antimicrobica]|uniref:DNA-binding transcriptional regulator, HxlR family n=1 Tax=Saccharopolyspora antimicrobica TaxID=455193 RepID=A0A1I5JU01_9PSEU|nr:helix-turn-helix domain-containing protein [Saccharopolyspora antimicrobica]RKT86935.1 HxlR family transcriptional regulator [Saccharopolyspora antimicrobica]SFO76209.1 DNA-binding transcriptional regulator, HxlR family [Saccharopolyspora antimicrobica]
MSVRARPHFCSLNAAVDILSGKWKILLLWELLEQPRRFGELRRLVPGIREKVLIQQLRELEADGVVARKAFDGTQLRVEYSLTEAGVALTRALEPLTQWSLEHVVRR